MVTLDTAYPNMNETKKKPNHASKALSIKSISKNIREFKYEIRGKILEVADKIQYELKNNPNHMYNFSTLIPANLGNPQVLGQKPITYHRQLLSCVLYPDLYINNKKCISEGDNIDSERAMDNNIPDDVISKAFYYLNAIGSVGAYSHSSGAQLLRNDIAEWFTTRDGFYCDPQSIYLTDGASFAIKTVIELLSDSPENGIMIPVPQYPLYAATIKRQGSTSIPYFLSEENQWRLMTDNLNECIEKAKNIGIIPKAFVLINPSNPTGSLLLEHDLVNVIKFCENNSLLLLCDEVYQENVYAENAKFVSSRSVLKKLNSNVELISFHSCSKGFTGECGLRGGLMQLENIDEDVIAILKKMLTVNLCSNTVGQIMITSMLSPPKYGDLSYARYNDEVNDIKYKLKKKAKYFVDKLNTFKGVVCQPIIGAMYAFPKISIPPKAIEVASQRNIAPDMLYCIEMLEETGVICVPGSAFGQVPGTYHFRITILPDEKVLEERLNYMYSFNEKFHEKYTS